MPVIFFLKNLQSLFMVSSMISGVSLPIILLLLTLLLDSLDGINKIFLQSWK